MAKVKRYAKKAVQMASDVAFFPAKMAYWGAKKARYDYKRWQSERDYQIIGMVNEQKKRDKALQEAEEKLH